MPTKHRIADRGLMTHLMELGPLSNLVLQLKKKFLNKPHVPVTMRQLDECTEAIQKIMQCRHRGLYK